MSHSFNRINDNSIVNNFRNVSITGMRHTMSSYNLGFLSSILASFNFIINIYCIPFRLLMRRDLGERSFSFFTFIICILFYAISGLALIWYGFIGWLQINIHPVPSLFSNEWQEFFFRLFLFLIHPYTIFCMLILNKGINHFKTLLIRAKEKKYSYSFSQGRSRFLEKKLGKQRFGFVVNDQIIRMIYEPIEVIKYTFPMVIFGIYIIWSTQNLQDENLFYYFFFHMLVGFFTVGLSLFLSALSVFIEELDTLLKMRSAVLDTLDGETDMKLIISSKEKIMRHVNSQQAVHTEKTINSSNLGDAQIN